MRNNIVKEGSVVRISINTDKKDCARTMSIGHVEDGILAISKESPVGKAIYQKKEGETVSYRVKDRDFTVTIQEVR